MNYLGLSENGKKLSIFFDDRVIELKVKKWVNARNLLYYYFNKFPLRDLYLAEVKYDFTLNFDSSEALGYLYLHGFDDRRIYGDIEMDIYPNYNYKNIEEILMHYTPSKVISLVKNISEMIKALKGIRLRKIVIGDGPDSISFLTKNCVVRYYSSGKGFLIDVYKTIEITDKELFSHIRYLKKDLLLSIYWNDELFQRTLERFMMRNNVWKSKRGYIFISQDPRAMSKVYYDIVNNFIAPLSDIFENEEDFRDKIKDKIREKALAILNTILDNS